MVCPKHTLLFYEHIFILSYTHSIFQTIDVMKFFCFLTVIGGYRIYLRMGINEECDKKDSVWEALKKKVLYVLVLNKQKGQ